MLVSLVNCNAEKYEVTFTLADGKTAYASKGAGKEKLISENGIYKVTFKNTEACFIMAE